MSIDILYLPGHFQHGIAPGSFVVPSIGSPHEARTTIITKIDTRVHAAIAHFIFLFLHCRILYFMPLSSTILSNSDIVQ